MVKKIVSFGYKHGLPGNPGFIIDVRNSFSNPWKLRIFRELTGLDEKVGYFIRRDTLNYDEKYARIKGHIEFLEGTAWIGCQGGKHRSVYLAERLGKELGVEVEHRDLHR